MKQINDIARLVRAEWVFNYFEADSHVNIYKFLKNKEINCIFPLGLGKNFYEGETLDKFYSQMLTDVIIIFTDKKRNGRTNDKTISLS